MQIYTFSSFSASSSPHYYWLLTLSHGSLADIICVICAIRGTIHMAAVYLYPHRFHGFHRCNLWGAMLGGRYRISALAITDICVNRSAMADYWWLIIDDWLLMTDYWLLIIDDWLLMTDYWWLIIDGWLLMADYWLLMTDYWCRSKQKHGKWNHELF